MEAGASSSSQEKLDRMMRDGLINGQEYIRLSGALSGNPSTPRPIKAALPWQIWVVIVILALEGIGNLASIPQAPIAALWLAVKCILIFGLWKRWKPVYILAIVLAAMHALFFALAAPLVSLINALLVVLLILARGYYFSMPPSE